MSKFQSKTITQNAPNQYLDFLIDPNSQGVNRLFVFAFNAIDNRKRNSRYYLPRTKIGEWNAMIDGKTFLINQLEII